jgi:RimJ/RimL family protein N-acetyltransferase
MEVERCSSPSEFLAASESYRSNEPIHTNVLGSVAVAVSNAERAYDDYWWWLVRHERVVVGAALRTAPLGLQLGPMPLETIDYLARAVALEDDEFPWVGGPRRLVERFLDSYRALESPGSHRAAVHGRTSRLYEVRSLRFPRVSGLLRSATLDDQELVAQWTADFHEYIEGVAPPPSDNDRNALIAKITSRRVSLWCTSDGPVAMAGYASRVVTKGVCVTRIGPVFTPAHNRSRGYGSAVTAALSDELLRGGSRVMLYADAENPTSNHVYRAIGFELVDEHTQLDFTNIT